MTTMRDMGAFREGMRVDSAWVTLGERPGFWTARFGLNENGVMDDQLTQAARDTMRGGAHVTLDLFYKFDGEEPGRGQLTGTVDFDAGRCELSGDGERYILDGPDEYRTADGGWLVSRGRPGTQSTMNPAWLLTRLTDAVVTGAR